MRFLRQVITALSITALLPVSALAEGRTAEEQAQGDKSYPQILASLGGAIDDPDLQAYVDEIGHKLVARSNQPDAKWTFVIADTPLVNAFSTPGGYIYITRGILALANDEAELAAVLGHEIAHVTAHHMAARESSGAQAGIGILLGAVLGGLTNGSEGLKDGIEAGAKFAAGYVAQNSQDQEFEADRLGIRLIAATGYDPRAQADFLDSLAAQAELEAMLNGQEYNPNRVSFFASHPATADRVRQAIAEAERQGIDLSTATARNQVAYFAAIDGMIYGDSAAQGFVRGRVFSHPVMGFTYEVPEGFVITNSAAAVMAEGPNRATLKLDGGRADGKSLSRFLTREWVPALARSARLGKPGTVTTLDINGLEAATLTIPGKTRNGNIVIQLTAIRMGDQVYRLTGVSRADDHPARDALAAAALTFRALDSGEAANLRPYRIETYTIQPGDTADLLAATLPFESFRTDIFRVMNALDEGQLPVAGDPVKLVAE